MIMNLSNISIVFSSIMHWFEHKRRNKTSLTLFIKIKHDINTDAKY